VEDQKLTLLKNNIVAIFTLRIA